MRKRLLSLVFKQDSNPALLDKSGMTPDTTLIPSLLACSMISHAKFNSDRFTLGPCLKDDLEGQWQNITKITS